MSRIVEVSILPFQFTVEGLALGEHAAMGVSNVECQPGGRIKSCATRLKSVAMTARSGGM